MGEFKKVYGKLRAATECYHVPMAFSYVSYKINNVQGSQVLIELKA